MPRVKIDYVVSFSSEDPEHPANNLLAREVSKKKWLCKMGEPSCSVVLQLAKAVKISGVHIGAYHAALVEVLVGRSEKPDDPFEVLVPSSVLLSPSESRGAGGEQRVRSFGAAALAPAAAQRWDRVRLVCAQPYNKHCKYGISFIHVDEPADETSASPAAAAAAAPAPAAAPAVPPRLLEVDAYSSEEDDFRPGELFATHRQRAAEQPRGFTTESQIRQATSQALKNISDSSSRLTKTPICKQPPRTPRHPSPPPAHSPSQHGHNRRPTQHREHATSAVKENTDSKEKQQEISKTQDKNKKQYNSNISDTANKRTDKTDESTRVTQPASDSRVDTTRGKRGDASPATSRDTKRDTSRDSNRATRDDTSRDHRGKRSRSSTDRDQTEEDVAGPRCSAPLRGVVFALSGYENPRRAHIRDLAVSLGARYCRDWSPACTHLVCAFPNTPKLRQLRASPGAARAAPAVRAEWVTQCAARRRRLPWRWHATEPQQRRAPPPPPHSHSESERDTDDEIEETLRKQKKRRQHSPEEKARASTTPSPSPAHTPPALPALGPGADDSLDDVQFVRDERMRGNVTVHDSDSEHTDHDEHAADEQEIDETKSLPNFFDGYTFNIDDSVTQANCDKELLTRYVRAYGGVIVNEEADYVLCAGAGGACGARGGAAVAPRWLWACHAQRRLLPPH